MKNLGGIMDMSTLANHPMVQTLMSVRKWEINFLLLHDRESKKNKSGKQRNTKKQ